MKKRTLIKFLLFLAFTATIFAAAEITSFSVNQDNDNAELSWTTNGQETSQQEFIILRKSANSSFAYLTTVPTNVNSPGHYQYVDNSIYKTTDQFYTYKVILVDKDNPNYYISSDQANVIIGNISGIKRTWGSIKAMFR